MDCMWSTVYKRRMHVCFGGTYFVLSLFKMTVKDHGHPQHKHWKSKQSYATFIKKRIKKTKERKLKSTTEMKNTLLYMTQSSDTQHMNKVETKFSSVVFGRGLKGAQRGWGKWWMNVTIKSAEMLMLYVKCYSRWRDTEAEREREREIMVCAVIFFTAKGNQLSACR